jgi:hypothetical protein
MPSLTKSSGRGRSCNFFSKLSRRMCRSRSRWCACSAGAAVESGRMLPVCAENEFVSLVLPLTNLKHMGL